MNFIRNLLKPKHGTGGVMHEPDERDYRQEEISYAAPVVEWKEKAPDQWRKFPIFNQDGSGSCVGQTVAKLLGIENFVEEGKFVRYSARDIYSRKYLPSSGMYYRDGMDIGYSFGATFEQSMPSEGMGEQPMRDASDRTPIDQHIGLIGKGGNYFSLPIDFDQIAAILETGKGVAIGTVWNAGMWDGGEVKVVKGGTIGHAVVAVDFCLWKGQKALVFDNSWGTQWGFKGQGILTADQNNGGINYAAYYASLPNNWKDTQQGQGNKPKHSFVLPMKAGERGQKVTDLQECLKWEGLFPVNISLTGFWGGITTKAVIAFQTKYGLPLTGQADLATLSQINKLFN